MIHSWSLSTSHPAVIRQSLKDYGCAVLRNVWSVNYLAYLFDFAHTLYKSPGMTREGDNTVVTFFKDHANREAEFLFEVERSGLIAMLRELFGSDVVLNREHHVIRRHEPGEYEVPLHVDDQLSRVGMNERTMTIWTPFQDCTSDVRSRLLLLPKNKVIREAPLVEAGSVVLFESTTKHGTFCPQKASLERYSMDFRVSKPYDPSQFPSLRGVVFSRGGF